MVSASILDEAKPISLSNFISNSSFPLTLQMLVGFCLQSMQEIILFSMISLQQGVQSDMCPHGSHTTSDSFYVQTRHSGY